MMLVLPLGLQPRTYILGGCCYYAVELWEQAEEILYMFMAVIRERLFNLKGTPPEESCSSYLNMSDRYLPANAPMRKQTTVSAKDNNSMVIVFLLS